MKAIRSAFLQYSHNFASFVVRVSGNRVEWYAGFGLKSGFDEHDSNATKAAATTGVVSIRSIRHLPELDPTIVTLARGKGSRQGLRNVWLAINRLFTH